MCLRSKHPPAKLSKSSKPSPICNSSECLLLPSLLTNVSRSLSLSLSLFSLLSHQFSLHNSSISSSTVRHCDLDERDIEHDRKLSLLFPSSFQCSAFISDMVNHFRRSVIPKVIHTLLSNILLLSHTHILPRLSTAPAKSSRKTTASFSRGNRTRKGDCGSTSTNPRF